MVTKIHLSEGYAMAIMGQIEYRIFLYYSGKNFCGFRG